MLKVFTIKKQYSHSAIIIVTNFLLHLLHEIIIINKMITGLNNQVCYNTQPWANFHVCCYVACPSHGQGYGSSSSGYLILY